MRTEGILGNLRGCEAGGQNPTPEMEEDLKQRLMSMMMCTSWVCTDTFDHHLWVSASTIPVCLRGERHGIGLRDWFSLCGTCCGFQHLRG